MLVRIGGGLAAHTCLDAGAKGLFEERRGFLRHAQAGLDPHADLIRLLDTGHAGFYQQGQDGIDVFGCGPLGNLAVAAGVGRYEGDEVAARGGGEMLQGFDDHAVGMKLAEVLCQILRAHETRTEEAFPRRPAGSDGDAEALGLRQKFENCIVRGVDHAAGRREQCEHERVPAMGVASIGLGALVEQHPHRGGAAVLGGEHERRAAVLVPGFDVGPFGKERFDLFVLAFPGGFQDVQRHVGRQRSESGENHAGSSHEPLAPSLRAKRFAIRILIQTQDPGLFPTGWQPR